MKQLNFDEIYNNAMRKRAEEYQQASKEIHDMTASSRARHEQYQALFDRLAKKADDEARAAMEDEAIEEQTKASAAAREAVRSKYKKQHAAPWNESESDQALRRMTKNLFGE